ncbi:TPA: integrase domain-containing protein [Vibrio parahaemolyticus]|nr:integrase domain-containing protein [Vibrio parahaemolyticus]
MRKKNYVGHLAKTPRDFNKPNFNLGSRDMVKALINASFENQGGMVTNTHRARLPAIKHFISFIKANTNIKRLNDIKQQHVSSFGEFLKNNADEELLSTATARDYLSHINRALAQARGDEECVVNATRDLEFTPKSGIAIVDSSVKEALHEKVLPHVTIEVGLVMQLQRFFGLRFREAALLEASRVLEEIHKERVPMLLRGAKGGQPRPLPVDSEEKYRLLVRVATFQQSLGQDSLIPSHLSFKAFQSEAWRQTKQANTSYQSHGERKHFACETYYQLMGVRCPVQANVVHGKRHHQYIASALKINEAEAKQRDYDARLKISKLLGHHRVSITNAYLG